MLDNRLQFRFKHVFSSGQRGSDPIYVAASFFDPSVCCVDVLIGWESRAKNTITFLVRCFYLLTDVFESLLFEVNQFTEGNEPVQDTVVREEATEPSVRKFYTFGGTCLRSNQSDYTVLSDLSSEIDDYLKNRWNAISSEEVHSYWNRKRAVKFLCTTLFENSHWWL